MKKVALAIALVVGIGSQALGADVVNKPYDWSGVYVGLHGGYSWGKYDFFGATTIGGAGGISIASDGKPDGFFIGGHAGAQYQLENDFVFGAEVDVDYRDVGSEALIRVLQAPNDDAILETEINWTASARLRAGYAIDRWLPYVTGGVAMAQFDLTGRSPDGVQGETLTETMTGWTAGVGTEYAITDNLLVRVEYRYSDFGDKADLFADGLPPGGHTIFNLASQDIGLGLSYKF
jgi:outer membrane immunogenic protein